MINKISVCAVLVNDEGLVLGVSRKYDHNDFGLVGGSMNPEDEGIPIKTAIREVKEETGLNVKDAVPIYFRKDSEFLVLTYLVTSWDGEINTDEVGVVKWTTFDELKKGCFGEYNTELHNHIKKYKLLDNNN